ncbi:hypothetical protein GSI_12238 [Ganoderma sinense ZZ0214-1]|uniref:Ribonucleoside-diphosphate reductase n=1 Tax=Ganoderma sinense ZZ0214-1 TaxID=1077348 RepID=A0A2G8RY89_9APHY|nr:hypothetical protein GSI_12238 [Ganoderma sinense ZZ0214-1]
MSMNNQSHLLSPVSDIPAEQCVLSTSQTPKSDEQSTVFVITSQLQLPPHTQSTAANTVHSSTNIHNDDVNMSGTTDDQDEPVGSDTNSAQDRMSESDHVIVNKVLPRLTHEITTYDLQGILALNTNMFSFVHPDFSTLAGRVFADRIHRSTMKTFSKWVKACATERPGLLRPDFVANVLCNAQQLDAAIMHARDFDYYFYSLQTLYKYYLLRDGARVIERPQFLYMRIAISLHGSNLDRVLDAYQLLSSRLYSPSTAILYNAGTGTQHFASSFVAHPPREVTTVMLDHILQDLTSMWKMDAAVGLPLAYVPSRDTTFRECSSGPIPMLDVIDAYAKFTCANRWRNAAVATTYLPIWHADIQAYIQSSTRSTPSTPGLRNVFPALLLPNLFMERLRDDGQWSLFDPVDVPLLFEVSCEDFDVSYHAYETAGVAVLQLRANELWTMLSSVLPSGSLPLLLFSDNINARSNEDHLGSIHGSSLCAEVAQHATPGTPAICYMVTVSLPRFIVDGAVDFQHLHRVTRQLVFNTDKSIDAADYPSHSLELAAKNTRALGIGVQGLADVFMLLGLPFTSPRARQLNIDIFETIYHAALDASCRMAEDLGPYPSWDDSPASHGILQVDMWEHTPSNRHDFQSLRVRIARHGLRNSVLTALSPAAATSKLLGDFEGFEPYARHVTASLLFLDLTLTIPFIKHHYCSPDRLRFLPALSIQSCPSIPDDLKEIYKMAWDIDPIDLIDMAVDRAPFIDQSQSLTFCLRNPSSGLLKRLMIHAWSSGLKTGIYCLRTLHPNPSATATGNDMQFVVRSHPIEYYT